MKQDKFPQVPFDLIYHNFSHDYAERHLAV